MEQEKTRRLTANEKSLVDRQVRTLSSAIVARAQLAAGMGSQSYGGDRDIYQALGYKTNLLYKDYEDRYFRQDIAKAIIDRPAKATWQGPLLLEESGQADETALEKGWKELDNRLGLKTRFQRIDRLSGIGGFGILLLGLNDTKTPEDFKNPVTVGKRELLYVKPYGESSVSIVEYEMNTKNPRYGLPLIYQIAVTDTKSGTTGSSMSSQPTQEKAFVHYTRVIHIIDDVLENEVVGSPKLEVVFNRLMDLEKIVGGDAEMFWRGARPGFQGKVDKEYQLTDQMKSDLKEQIDEYEHNLRRMLVNEGVSYEALAQQIADPTPHVDIQIQMISTVTGIPKRILTGTERGELSSNQDASEWRSYVGGRRLDHAEPHIVRPFVNRCIELGVLPALIGDSYKVAWSDLYAMSEAESVKIGLDRSTSLKNYTSSPMAEAVMSPEGFLLYCMGFDDNQIAIINKASNSEILKEQQLIGLFPTEETAAADLKSKTQPKVQPVGVPAVKAGSPAPVIRTRKPIAK